MGAVREDVIFAIEDGCETNVEIAEYTGHPVSTIASCTRRMILEKILITKGEFHPGPGQKHHYFLNPALDAKPIKPPEPFKVPEHEPVLAAFFGIGRYKCESS